MWSDVGKRGQVGTAVVGVVVGVGRRWREMARGGREGGQMALSRATGVAHQPFIQRRLIMHFACAG